MITLQDKISAFNRTDTTSHEIKDVKEINDFRTVKRSRKLYI